ncbi:MAG: RHS repeat-associated core domain-containing protein [Fimbriimonadaceae bacterium]
MGPSSWSYNNDILGNRTDRNYTTSNAAAMRYDWDVLNRAKNILKPSSGASYYYRADGMRTEKVEGINLSWVQVSRASGYYDTNTASNRPTTRYFYDGQMPIEEDYTTGGSVTKVTRNALGARGIDMISVTTSSGTNTRYPIYDGHGNCIATLAKSGTNSYSMGDWRTYDVWGSVRSGNTTGDPTKRYVANLGHQADDESDLIYMRARYYEPASGRFVSEDPAMDGSNWFTYCDSNSLNFVDESGEYKIKHKSWWNYGQLMGYVFGLGAVIFAPLTGLDPAKKLGTVASMLAMSVAGFSAALSFGSDYQDPFKMAAWMMAGLSGLSRAILSMAGSLSWSSKAIYSLAAAAVIVTTINVLMIMGALFALEIE